MSGEITLKKNTTNTQSTNNEESNKVHYHLSANVKFDKDNAFNGTTDPGGSCNNPNIEKFSVQITTSRDANKKFINSRHNRKIIAKLKNYEKIMINNNLYELKPVNNGDNLEISGCNDKIDNGTWTCGKDGQSCPVTCGMPSALVSKLTVGGES